MPKRSILDELMEGVAAMKSHREGVVVLRKGIVNGGGVPKSARLRGNRFTKKSEVKKRD